MTASTADLPAGIVTFVFTDIEGSTRLFYSLGEGYSRVLERHRQILREAWSAHHGHEMSVEGDAFFVAFERAGDAVRACIAAQRALLDEAWPANGRVLVRMGIHTGLATPMPEISSPWPSIKRPASSPRVTADRFWCLNKRPKGSRQRTT